MSQPPIQVAEKNKSPCRKIAKVRTKEEVHQKKIVNDNIKKKETIDLTASQFMKKVSQFNYSYYSF